MLCCGTNIFFVLESTAAQPVNQLLRTLLSETCRAYSTSETRHLPKRSHSWYKLVQISRTSVLALAFIVRR